MNGLLWRRLVLTALLAVAGSARGAVLSAQTVSSSSSARAAAAAQPVAALLATAEGHFQAGEQELALGHFEAARLDFNRSVDVLLESKYGTRTDPRVREYFDRLVDRISVHEAQLPQGDAFDKPSEAAPLDELLALSPTSPAPAVAAGGLQADLGADGHDIPIPLNRRVLSYIELFQGRLHDFIQAGMQRGSKYLPMIQSVFRAEGLPLDLAYVPLIESAFKADALSRAKAKGVWQFMSGTALENGLHRDWYIDERSDPEKATVAAARYLGTLQKLFDGDWHLALASYNGGPGRLQRAMKTAGMDDFWKLSEKKPKLLPRETREYVPMILAAMVIARNPAQYGFDFVPEAAQAYDTVTLTRPVDLRRVAEWAATSTGDIQSLNPELRRWTTPVKDTGYQLRVPAGTADVVQAHLAEGAGPDLSSLKWYTARRGDTLSLIARRMGVTKTDLAEANYLKTTARVSAGQKLLVPHEAGVLMAVRADKPAPAAEARKVQYQVKRGDTLASIARAFKTSVASIRVWNRLPGDHVEAGARLTLYQERKPSFGG